LAAHRGSSALLDGAAGLAPGTDAAVHGHHPPVAHGAQALRRQRRPVAAAAIEDDLLVLVRDERLDVALEHAAADVARARRMVDRVLAVLAHVDEVEVLAPREPRAHLRDRAFADVFLRLRDDLQEPWAVLHACAP